MPISLYGFRLFSPHELIFEVELSPNKFFYYGIKAGLIKSSRIIGIEESPTWSFTGWVISLNSFDKFTSWVSFKGLIRPMSIYYMLNHSYIYSKYIIKNFLHSSNKKKLNKQMLVDFKILSIREILNYNYFQYKI